MSTLTDTTPARVIRTVRGRPTSDGAGVKLTRVIGGPDLPDLDPFLLLDEFGTDKAEDYIAGFPEHPHRGFETVTYMLDGRMRPDSCSGISECTSPRPAVIHCTAPKYQEFAPDRIPVAKPAAGVEVKVIAGRVGDVQGPISQPATDPVYLDIALDAGKAWEYALPAGHNAFAYVFEGALTVGEGDEARPLDTHEMGVLGGGEVLRVRAGSRPARVILVAGRPLREPVMRHGPFVMNTRQELMQAFVDFQEGRF